MRNRWALVGVALFGAAVVGAACSGEDSGSSGSSSNNNSGSGGDGGSGGSSDGGATSSSNNTGGGIVDPCEGVTCDPGEVCDDGECVEGCSETEPCGGSLSCCDGVCVDVANDVDACGSCDEPCDIPPNTNVTCSQGICNVGACEDGFYDCDGIVGCESDTPCSCEPGTTQPCYPGPAGTENQGLCQSGTRTCNAAGTAWSLCNGFVTPTAEICGNNIDEDCSGVADDVPDLDGDGWTVCDNDCCETTQDCADPNLVNPGAFEFVGNSVDDDCDPATVDNTAPPPCSTAADFSGITGNELAMAMDLCQFTTANEPLPTRKWGVVAAELVRPDGSAPAAAQLTNIRNNQTAVMTAYGTGGVVPQNGPTMGGISSGFMGDANDPGAPGSSGNSYGYYQQPPAGYLAANGGQLPGSLGCSGACPNGNGANDGVNLRLSIRVPTNALSFSYDFRFFSAEYFTYQCTTYNDFYLALLTTGAQGIPADGNISFDAQNNPVSVNNGFFEYCNPSGGQQCSPCINTIPLQGTIPSMPTQGGATGWLQTTAPIVPGETMILQLMIFDVSDDWLDSHTLIDNFQWSVDASDVGTGPPG